MQESDGWDAGPGQDKLHRCSLQDPDAAPTILDWGGGVGVWLRGDSAFAVEKEIPQMGGQTNEIEHSRSAHHFGNLASFRLFSLKNQHLKHPE